MNKIWKVRSLNILISLVISVVLPILLIGILTALRNQLTPSLLKLVLIPGLLVVFTSNIWFYISIYRLANLQKYTLNKIFFKEIGSSLAIIQLTSIIYNSILFGNNSNIISTFILSIGILTILFVGTYTLIRAYKYLSCSEEYQGISCNNGFKWLKLSAYFFLTILIIIGLLFTGVLIYMPSLKVLNIISIVSYATMGILGILSFIFFIMGWIGIYNHHKEIEFEEEETI